jgi:hypothetical protein
MDAEDEVAPASWILEQEELEAAEGRLRKMRANMSNFPL